jgi:hypothetical protein
MGSLQAVLKLQCSTTHGSMLLLYLGSPAMLRQNALSTLGSIHARRGAHWRA